MYLSPFTAQFACSSGTANSAELITNSNVFCQVGSTATYKDSNGVVCITGGSASWGSDACVSGYANSNNDRNYGCNFGNAVSCAIGSGYNGISCAGGAGN